MSSIGYLAYRIAEAFLGTPIKQRSDAEIRWWAAAGFATMGVLSYFSWKVVVSPSELGAPSKILSGTLGTLTGLGSAIALLTALSSGPFVRSMSEIRFTTRSGVPKVIFKGKG